MGHTRVSPPEQQVYEWTLKIFGLTERDAEIVQQAGTPVGVLPRNILDIFLSRRDSNNYVSASIIRDMSRGKLNNIDPRRHTIVKNMIEGKPYPIYDRIWNDFLLKKALPQAPVNEYWLNIIRDANGRIKSHGKRNPKFVTTKK